MASYRLDHRPDDEPSEFYAQQGGDAPADDPEGSSAMGWLSDLARREAARTAGESHDQQPLDLPKTFGKFRLLALLGTGGYGAVFRAFDSEIERDIALKVAWPHIMFGRASALRFAEEAKAAGGLTHPGIVRLYNSVWIDGVDCIELELIDGPSLADWLKNQASVPFEVAATIIASVAEALDYAHGKGVIHRDLKPSNILLRPRKSEGVFPFELLVTDFGQAHRTRPADLSALTRTHEAVGTQPYIAPEHLDDSKTKPAATSDVFSLGVVLYELIAGRRPFLGESTIGTADAIRHDDPPPLRALRSKVPRDLETIVGACLEKTPSRRYQSAAELACDLRHFIAGEPITRHRPGPWRRFWSAARKHPRITSVAATASIATILLAVLLGWWLADRRAARKEVEAAQASEALADGLQRQQQYATSIRYAARSQDRGNRTAALGYLEECSQLASGPVHQGVEWYVLSALVNDVDHVLRAHLGGVRAIRFLPSSDTLVSGGADSRIIFWDVRQRAKQREIFHPGWGVLAIEPSGDGTLLAVGGKNGRIVVYRTGDGSVVFNEPIVRGRVFDVIWLGEGAQFAVGGEDAVVSIVDLSTGERRQTAPLEPSPTARSHDRAHPNEISGLAYVPQRNLIVVAKAPSEVVMINASTMQRTGTWGDNIEDVWGMSFIPAGRGHLACGGNSLRIFSMEDGASVQTIPTPQNANQLRYVPTTRLLLAGGRDGSVQTWNIGEAVDGHARNHRHFSGHESRVLSVDCSQDGKWLASGGQDGTICLWENPALGRPAETPMGNRPEILEFSPCGRWLAVSEQVSDEKELALVIDVNTGRLLWSAELSRPYRGFAFDPSGEEVAMMEADGSVCGRKSNTGEVICTYCTPDSSVGRFEFAPNGHSFVVRALSKALVMDRRTCRVTLEIPEGRSLLGSFESTNGEMWIDTDRDRVCRIRRQPLETPFYTTEPTAERVGEIALSRDGRYLATDGGASQVIHLWDLSQKKPASKLIGHEEKVRWLWFSPDGATLLSHGQDDTLRFWHVPTRSELLTIGSATEKVLCAGLHPEGKMLVIGVEHEKTYGLRVYRLGDESSSLPKTFALSSGDAD
jgi:eukaryotic-like serine/threonine-protein kinase